MADVQPEAALDLEALLPYSIVITALQGQKHPALSDAQPRCLASSLSVCVASNSCAATKTKGGEEFMLIVAGI